jgi:hypothetical protein
MVTFYRPPRPYHEPWFYACAQLGHLRHQVLRVCHDLVVGAQRPPDARVTELAAPLLRRLAARRRLVVAVAVAVAVVAFVASLRAHHCTAGGGGGDGASGVRRRAVLEGVEEERGADGRLELRDGGALLVEMRLHVIA